MRLVAAGIAACIAFLCALAATSAAAADTIKGVCGVSDETFRDCRETALVRRTAWLEKAEACKPRLVRRDIAPVRLVKAVSDKAAFQGWRVVPCGAADDALKCPLAPGDSFIFDFGEHLVGTVAFRLVDFGKAVDAPVLLKFTFAEVPLELVEDEPSAAGWKGDVTPVLTFASDTFATHRANIKGTIVMNANELKESFTSDRVAIPPAELERLVRLMEHQ